MPKEYMEFIRTIRAEIKNQHENYNAYVHSFEDYRDFLEKRLAEDPTNVDALCQLATVYLELRYDSEAYYNLYQQFLLANEATLTNAQKARIYNNLTALCDQDWWSKGIEKYAPLAISCGSENAYVYDVYGRILWENAPIGEYEWCFERANELGQSLELVYNLAVARYRMGKLTEADAMFTVLLEKYPDNDRILHAKALCLIRLSVEQNREEILAIAKQLEQMPKASLADIDEVDIATLYFLCGRHGDYRRVVDSSEIRYANGVHWLAPYFYSMKVRSEEEELSAFYQTLMEEEDEYIANSEDAEDEAERIVHKQEIVTAYEKVQAGECPAVEPKLYFINYRCYLDDCPRHGKFAGKSVE